MCVCVWRDKGENALTIGNDSVAGDPAIIPEEEKSEGGAAMGVYVIGLVGVIAFYVAVLGVGIWAAAVKKKKSRHGHDALILANRGLGPILGVFTLIGKFHKQIRAIIYLIRSRRARMFF